MNDDECCRISRLFNFLYIEEGSNSQLAEDDRWKLWLLTTCSKFFFLILQMPQTEIFSASRLELISLRKSTELRMKNEELAKKLNGSTQQKTQTPSSSFTFTAHTSITKQNCTIKSFPFCMSQWLQTAAAALDSTQKTGTKRERSRNLKIAIANMWDDYNIKMNMNMKTSLSLVNCKLSILTQCDTQLTLVGLLIYIPTVPSSFSSLSVVCVLWLLQSQT